MAGTGKTDLGSAGADLGLTQAIRVEKLSIVDATRSAAESLAAYRSTDAAALSAPGGFLGQVRPLPSGVLLVPRGRGEMAPPPPGARFEILEPPTVEPGSPWSPEPRRTVLRAPPGDGNRVSPLKIGSLLAPLPEFLTLPAEPDEPPGTPLLAADPGALHSVPSVPLTLPASGGYGVSASVTGARAMSITAAAQVGVPGKGKVFLDIDPAAQGFSAEPKKEQLVALALGGQIETKLIDTKARGPLAPGIIVQKLPWTSLAEGFGVLGTAQVLVVTDPYVELRLHPHGVLKYGDDLQISVWASEKMTTGQLPKRIPLGNATVHLLFYKTAIPSKGYEISGSTHATGYWNVLWTGFKHGKLDPGKWTIEAQVQIGTTKVIRRRTIDVVSKRTAEDPLATLLETYSPYRTTPTEDPPSISDLRTSDTYPDCGLADNDRLVIILVNDVLRDKAGLPSITKALDQFRNDLDRDGFRARVVWAQIYSGQRRQDGRTLLAIRRFFFDVRKRYPYFAGAILVGPFPDARIMRVAPGIGLSGNWDFTDPNAGEIYDTPWLACRSDLPLADLDGSWGAVYREETFTAPVRATSGGMYAGTTTSARDVFFLNDESPPVATTPSSTNKADAEIASTDKKLLKKSDFLQGSGYSAAKALAAQRFPEEKAMYFDKPAIHEAKWADPSGLKGYQQTTAGNWWQIDEQYPLAIPDILVSRINPRPIAGSDPKLERLLINEYFSRNSSYRSAGYKQHRLSGGVTQDQNGQDFSRYFIVLEGRNHVTHGTFRLNPTINDAKTGFFKDHALLRSFHGHGATYGFKLNDYDWLLAGNLHEVWQKNVMSGQYGSFYYCIQCDANKPSAYWNSPNYESTYGTYGWYDSYHYGGTMAEALLFHGNGLAVLARSRSAWDELDHLELGRLLAEGYPIGEAWRANILRGRRQRDLKTAKATRHEKDRKESYAWTMTGDWTLRLTYVETGSKSQTSPTVLGLENASAYGWELKKSGLTTKTWPLDEPDTDWHFDPGGKSGS